MLPADVDFCRAECSWQWQKLPYRCRYIVPIIYEFIIVKDKQPKTKKLILVPNYFNSWKKIETCNRALHRELSKMGSLPTATVPNQLKGIVVTPVLDLFMSVIKIDFKKPKKTQMRL